MYLSLGTSLSWDEYGLGRLAVVHRGRALPVVWRVLKHRRASVAFDAYREMLHPAAERWPSDIKVVVLADRGFVHTDAMTMMTTRNWGGTTASGIKRYSWIWRVGHGGCQRKDIHLQRGRHSVDIL